MERVGTLKSKDLFPSIFSRHAAAYQQRLDEIMIHGQARGRQRVLELLRPKPGIRVLDLACGPGTLTKPLAASVMPGGEVVGIDLAEGMIALARAAAIPNARFEVMDIEELDFPDASFDAVACGHGLQFAPDLPRGLGEACRVLKPGARFAASVPVEGGAPGPWEAMDKVVDRWLPPAPKATDRESTRATLNHPVALRQAILTAGFVQGDVEIVEDRVLWDSAAQLVSRCVGWWDLAARLDGVSASRRQEFVDDAISTLRREYPGSFEIVGRTHVFWGVA
jgi:ubiquinone/menaquinone biosynthesis C-methylase UbiE